MITTCLVIYQLTTNQVVATMLWPDGIDARLGCESRLEEWNAKARTHGKGYEARCEPVPKCPPLGNPEPEPK